MTAIKLAYVGGGSARAAGTMAAFIVNHGAAFDGSRVSLIDIHADHVELVRRIADAMARARGLDIRFEGTTDRRAGLAEADAVLTSYRPGGFEARMLDEKIPLRHGIIGQETQGPGGFFMALRSIHVLKGMLADVEAVAPHARVFNYTNPVNILADAATRYSPVPFHSFCEGAYDFPEELAQAAGLDPTRLTATMVGLNHTIWSTDHAYDGGDLMTVLDDVWADMQRRKDVSPADRRFVKLAVMMRSVPSQYLRYYYFHDEIRDELLAKPTSRGEDILSWLPDYWAHYAEQAQSPNPTLDPKRSRGGIFELELALDAMDSYYNDKGLVLPINTPNVGGALPGFPEDLVVEVWTKVDRDGMHAIKSKPLPGHVVGLIKMLGEYQRLAADAAWKGTRIDAIRALASHPWVLSLDLAEQLYDEMAAAQRAYLPDRLLA